MAVTWDRASHTGELRIREFRAELRKDQRTRRTEKPGSPVKDTKGVRPPQTGGFPEESMLRERGDAEQRASTRRTMVTMLVGSPQSPGEVGRPLAEKEKFKEGDSSLERGEHSSEPYIAGELNIAVSWITFRGSLLTTKGLSGSKQ